MTLPSSVISTDRFIYCCNKIIHCLSIFWWYSQFIQIQFKEGNWCQDIISLAGKARWKECDERSKTTNDLPEPFLVHFLHFFVIKSYEIIDRSFFWIRAFISKSLYDKIQKYMTYRFNYPLWFFCMDSLSEAWRCLFFLFFREEVEDGVVVVIFFREVYCCFFFFFFIVDAMASHVSLY